MSPANAKPRISISDIENKLRDMTDPVEKGVEKAKSIAVAGAVAVGALLVMGAYLAGRRRGKRRMPVIEVRRI